MKIFKNELNKKKNNLIKKAKQYLLLNNNPLSSLNYLYTNGSSAGYYRLKTLESYRHNLKYISEYLKEVAANFFKSSELEFINNKRFKISYQKTYLTWGSKINFSNKGIFYDKYFKNSSSNKKNLWIIIYEEKLLPKKLSDNILIVHIKNKKFSFFNFIKNILLIIKNSEFSITNFFRYLPFSSVFALSINQNLFNIIKNIKFKIIYIPYESQPFQQYFIKIIKEKFRKKVKVIGYIHSFLPAMPTYYIHRKFSPDKLLVHGISQKKILTNHLGWKSKKIEIIQSLRFQKKDVFDKNYFFVSYNLFKNSNKNLENFELFLRKTKDFTFKKCEVKLHPAKKDDRKHLSFKFKIQKILSKFSKKFSQNKFSKKINFCFGESSVIIESLERGVEVIHFSIDPILEVFDGDLWKNIVVKEISKNVYHYKLKKRGLYLRFK